jgi:hypothetical protein
VTVGGRVEDRDERDDVRIVDSDELVRFFVLLQVLKFVDDNIHGAASGLFVHLLMESRR